MHELVYLKNDEVVCTSLQIAEKFGKQHKHVIRNIENLLEGMPKIGLSEMFKKGTYAVEGNNKRYPMYYMNRDGFALLAMGFTGKKAIEWKVQYINAFNAMEAALKERNTQAWIEQRKRGKLARQAETDIIKQLVTYAQEQGSEHAQMLYVTYSKLANQTLGITNRETATVMQLNSLTLIENIILHQVREGMEKELHYKEIYKNCKNQIEAFKAVAYLETVMY